MWSSFDNAEKALRGSNSFILEPSAGSGAIINSFPYDRGFSYKKKIDVCEVNKDRIAMLIANDNVSLVGYDFLEFIPKKSYTHIIMNPPFRVGVKHLLHAWRIIKGGEIVCLLSAEGIKSPKSNDEKLLASLVTEYGSTRFMEGAFLSEDTVRRTTVECAIVHLKKPNSMSIDFFEGLALDDFKFEHAASEEVRDIAIPNSVIENAVKIYNAATEVLLRKTEADQTLGTLLRKYESILGSDFKNTNSVISELLKERARLTSLSGLASSYNEYVDLLKMKAWDYVFNGLNFYQKLSSASYNRLQRDFENVKKLEFSEENIKGFLDGFAINSRDIYNDMMLDVFDKITERHLDNRAFYKSWKSNAKHRTMAWRIKSTRIVLPRRLTSYGWYGCTDFEGMRAMGDFDKVFAILDGKDPNAIDGIEKVARRVSLGSSTRHDSEYFQWRYYHGAGTIHLYPKRLDLIDKLNVTVGRLRAWLPEKDIQASKEFWDQYNKAEKVTSYMNIDTKGVESFNWESHHHDKLMDRLSDAHLAACNKLKVPLDGFLAASVGNPLALSLEAA
jgi:hypothetical protein